LINLNNYRLTGGVLFVCKGIYTGTCDLIAGETSKNMQSACIIYRNFPRKPIDRREAASMG